MEIKHAGGGLNGAHGGMYSAASVELKKTDRAFCETASWKVGGETVGGGWRTNRPTFAPRTFAGPARNGAGCSQPAVVGRCFVVRRAKKEAHGRELLSRVLLGTF